MKYTVRKSLVHVLGVMWMPMVPGALVMDMRPGDVDYARDDDGKITRESVSLWIDSHCGDFSEITDFSASIEDHDETIDIPWSDEDNEIEFSGCMYGDED